MNVVGIVGMILPINIAMMISSRVYADPDNLQDICVADLTSVVRVNGFPCKSNVSADDFFTAAIANSGVINDPVGFQATRANVLTIPGVNTLGMSLTRGDFAPRGLNPPHTHPRATEIIYVLKGSLHVGFITTDNILISKIVRRGEVYVFPKGLVHFQQNIGIRHAAVISSYNSQFPGTQRIVTTLFTATPPVPDNILAQAFRVDVADIQRVKSRFA